MNPLIYSQFPGDAGIHQTLMAMRDLVNQSYMHPYIRERAASIVGSERNLDYQDYALVSYVNRTMQYLKDPTDLEALHNPVTWIEDRLRNGQNIFGDCDDMSVYLATLLKSIGHRPRFRVVSRTWDSWHHVLVYCHDKNLDPTMEIGNFPRHPIKAMQVEI